MKLLVRTDLAQKKSFLDALSELNDLGVLDNATGEIIYDDQDAELTQKITEIADKMK